MTSSSSESSRVRTWPRSWRGCAIGAAILASTLVQGGGVRAEGDELAAARGHVARALDILAGRGHGDDLIVLDGVLLAFGEAPDTAARALESAQRKLARTKEKNDRSSDVARLLDKARDGGVTALAATDGDARTVLAEALLAIDADCVSAWQALGFQRHDGGWIPADLVPSVERRAAILDALAAARRLDVPLETSASDDFLIQALYGSGVRGRHGSFEIHAHGVPEEKVRRIAREVLRAVALSRFVMGHDAVELPTRVPSEKEGGRTFDRPPEVIEMMRLADAGIRGARAWMEYLAAREEDPAWSRSFQDQVGKIQGDDLTKATFDHRLPLLEPGLVRIGWGLHDGFAVLDSGSMVGRFPYVTLVRFPAPDSAGVPLGFAPELPHPVPGEDQSAWGYPVTLQVIGETDPLADVTMRLRIGGADGPEVACHYSTPLAPANPELAPHNAFCLIPKQRLAANTTYTVVCAGLPDDRTETWTFTTGR